MAFQPKSKAAIGIPQNCRRQALSDQLDMGMKCYLRQTPLNNATRLLRQSLTTNDQQAEGHSKEHWTMDAKKSNSSINLPSDEMPALQHHSLCQKGAQAFPILLPKPSHLGRNTYEHFVGGLNCEAKKRRAYYRSLVREEEKTRLKILNSFHTPKEEVVYGRNAHSNASEPHIGSIDTMKLTCADKKMMHHLKCMTSCRIKSYKWMG